MKTINCFAYLGRIFIILAFMFGLAQVDVMAGNARNRSGARKSANGNQSGLWQQTAERNLPERGRRLLEPEKYLTFRLNQAALRDMFAQTPLEFSGAARDRIVIMEVPMPDGKLSRFRIEESPVLATHLAEAFPAWKTFQGFGIDDPTATARFDWTITGFHGYLLTEKGTVYIDPYQENDHENYLVYYKHDYGSSEVGDFGCKVNDILSTITTADFSLFRDDAEFTNGAAIRTYRLAVATTGEWARSTTMSTDPQTVRTAALASLTTSVNRLDGIFRREIAVTFQLVNPAITNNATNIIFDDPATDPYNNTDGIPQLTVNQTTIDNRVGIPNYDVGHLYGTGGGGVASTPSVCDTDKAQGYSARDGIPGDPFTVDYVAHELGHQFGANHTYNNRDPGGACTTRSAANAFEVASGSTIMSYVGICNERNLQQFVDTGTPAFHTRSLTEMITYLQTGTGNTCGTPSGTNNIPTINAGQNFTIPRLTPFTLTATGGDADPGDVANLLYSWEQYDLAPSASGALGTPANTYDVDTDGILRPLFRAYSPVASPSRTFPSMAYVLNTATNNPAGSNNPGLTFQGAHATGFPGATCQPMATCVIGESLPSVARTMNFRVAVRDRRGGVADAGMTVTVNAAAGPFRVSSPNTNVTLAGNSPQTVTWDVAGSGANAANVNILLSTDGGATFPTTILAATPNDGTQQVTIPNTATTQARIKIEAAGNIFFDVGDTNFTITATQAIPRSRADFDGDGRTDLSVFRPSEGNWYLNRSTSGLNANNWGQNGDVPVPGDYDNDGKTDLAVFRPDANTANPDFFVLNSNGNTITSASWGLPADIPVVGDYDGDSKTDYAVFRPSDNRWYVLKSSGGFQVDAFGSPGDIPMVMDYEGDGKANYTVFRPGNTLWYIAKPTGVPAQNFHAIPFGLSSDTPVPADYDNDNKDDIAMFRASTGIWYVLRSTNGAVATTQFGLNGDVPVPGDYDGDGGDDIAVYRNGVWHILRSTAGLVQFPFGIGSDIPIPNRYIR